MRKQISARFYDETEGAFRYREVDSSGAYIHADGERAIVGDIYLRKLAIAGKRPDQIKITIEY